MLVLEGDLILIIFLKIYDNQKLFGGEIPYKVTVENESGLDYSGIYRDVVSDMLSYWFPRLNFSFLPNMGYEIRWPNIFTLGADKVNYLKFGKLMGYLASIKAANPSIRGHPVNLASI